MADNKTDTKTSDPQDLLRLLKDVFALDLTDLQREKLMLFLSGKGFISLNGRKYTKDDLKDLFYTQN